MRRLRSRYLGAVSVLAILLAVPSHAQQMFRAIEGGALGNVESGSVGAHWNDYDRDGDLDLMLARRQYQQNVLLDNNDGGAFSTVQGVITEALDDSNSLAWGDYDHDGDPGLYVLNTGGSEGGTNRLFQNTEDGFVEILEGPHVTDIGRSQSANWVDFDNDLDLDLFVTNAAGQNNVLYRNDGGTFVALTESVVAKDGSASFGSVWGDIDNDGDQDLVVAVRGAPDLVYLNAGEGEFEQRSLEGTEDGSGMAVTLPDIDGDGRLDLLITQGAGLQTQRDRLYQNVGQESGWLKVRTTGLESNRAGIGAHVYVKAEIGGVARWQLREVSAMSGRNAQSGNGVHFGLGDATMVDSIVVRWPSGIEQVIEAVEPNQTLDIVEAGTVGGEPTVKDEVSLVFGFRHAYPNPAQTSVSLDIVLTVLGLYVSRCSI